MLNFRFVFMAVSSFGLFTHDSRFKLNSKKNKVDDHPIKNSNSYSTQQLMLYLSCDINTENLKDESCKMPLSKSLVGGSMNICKTRVLNFVPPDRSVQVVTKLRNKMIMLEKPSDGTIAMHYGEIEEDYLPTLPNTATPLIVGLAVSTTAYAGKYSIQAWSAFKPRPATTRMHKFYEGGFQPTMTIRLFCI